MQHMAQREVKFITIALLAGAAWFSLPAAAAADSACVAYGAGGVVSSACSLATEAGVRVLEAGGGAVDAAIAVGFVLAVTFPEAGNLGGGGFMLVHSAEHGAKCLDFRETAPAAAAPDMFLDAEGRVIPQASLRGRAASGVPGTVAGLHLAYRLYGSLPWEELVAPAQELAREGFCVGPRLQRSLERLGRHVADWPGLAKFMRTGGEPLGAGEVLRQPLLADVLGRIAREGPEDFYRGRTAALIVAEMERGGGLISADDLAAYSAVEREPIRGTYRGYEICSAPPPSSGGIVLMEILNIIEGFDLAYAGPGDEEMVHFMIEAQKRAYADRAVYLGDPDYVAIPVERLISKEYAASLRAGIGPRATCAAGLAAAGQPASEKQQTTHYSILDRRGTAVAATITLNGAYGSYVVVEGAGFLMNNEMDDFSLAPGVPNMYGLVGGEANRIEPGKRMLSSMTPTIVLRDGRPWLVLGTPGGATIITTVAQLVVVSIDFGMNAREAVAAARFHHQWLPDKVFFEPDAFSDRLAAALAGRGHILEARASIGDAQVIAVRDGIVCGASDPRHEGAARAEAAHAGEVLFHGKE